MTLDPVQYSRLQAARQALAAGNMPYAEQLCRALISERARSAGLFGLLARICTETGRAEEAQRLWKRVLELDPNDPDALLVEARSLEQAGDSDAALKRYRRIVSRNPELIIPRYLMANLHKARGENDEARALYLKIIADRPDYTQAHFSYAGVHRYTDRDDPHLRQLLELDKRPLSNDGRIQVSFALAKAFEDLDDFERAFEFLQAGNGLRAQTFDYDIESDRELFENIMRTFTAEAIEACVAPGCDSARPVFIVGMPRSGTSLVEKILGSHSAVLAGGELDDFYRLVVERFLNPQRHYQFDALSSYDSARFTALGRDYVARLDRLGGQVAHVTDKLPFNMLMIGMIRIALPNAKIIHCVRDPRDTCLSIYKQNFTTDNYRFGYDLGTLAEFHNLYRRLMKHWDAVFPGAIVDVSYEDLTHAPEREIRRLLSACGLEWEGACLEFHRNPGVVTTASAWQVRQPMYTRSVGLWEKYGAALEPLIDRLEID